MILCSIWGRAILLAGSKNTIQENTFTDIGLHAGKGISGNNPATAIRIAGSNNTIYRNTVNNVGYAGVSVNGRYNNISYNQITNSMLTLTDGSALYTYGTSSQYNWFYRNTIRTVVGNAAASAYARYPARFSRLAVGIYLDDLSAFSFVVENVFDDAGTAAIQIHNSNNNIVAGNIFSKYLSNLPVSQIDTD